MRLHHSEEWRRRQAEGMRKAWADGKFLGKRRPNYISIAEKNRGKKRPKMAIEATRIGVKKAWANGVYNKPETVKKRRRHLARLALTNTGASKEFMDRIRSCRNMEKLRPKLRETMRKNLQRWKETGELEQFRLRQRKALLGKHGFGKSKRGSLEHPMAKSWAVRSPFGQVFTFVNAREWVRKNIHRFNDERPQSKMPFWHRVSSGLKNIAHPRRPNSPTHYQGWTIISLVEKEDLLGRDGATIL